MFECFGILLDLSGSLMLVVASYFILQVPIFDPHFLSFPQVKFLLCVGGIVCLGGLFVCWGAFASVYSLYWLWMNMWISCTQQVIVHKRHIHIAGSVIAEWKQSSLANIKCLNAKVKGDCHTQKTQHVPVSILSFLIHSEGAAMFPHFMFVKNKQRKKKYDWF